MNRSDVAVSCLLAELRSGGGPLHLIQKFVGVELARNLSIAEPPSNVVSLMDMHDGLPTQNGLPTQSQYFGAGSEGNEWWRLEGTSETTAWMFVAIWVAYAVAVIRYEIQEYEPDPEEQSIVRPDATAQTQSKSNTEQTKSPTQHTLSPRQSAGNEQPQAALAVDKPKKARVPLWDLCKFVAHIFVQYSHFGSKMSMGYEGDLFMHQAFYWSSSWKMSAFVFISGVFGQSLAKDALSKMCCYGIASPFFISCLYLLICWGSVVFTGVYVFPTGHSPNHIWYPFAMVYWRLALVPFRNLTRRKGIPYPVAFMVVLVLSFLARHATPQHLPTTHWSEDTTRLSFGYRYYQDVLLFSPFYFAGLYMSHQEWTQLLLSIPHQTFAVLIFVAWNLSLVSMTVRRLATISCMGSVLQCDCDHWPTTNDPPPVSLDSFLVDCRDYTMKFTITFAFIWTVAWITGPLRQVFPQVMKYILAAGTRTMYGYLLHIPLFIILGLRMGFPLLLSRVPPALFPAVGFLLCMFSALVLCSKLTEKLFRWMVLPFWMQEYWERLFCCS